MTKKEFKTGDKIVSAVPKKLDKAVSSQDLLNMSRHELINSSVDYVIQDASLKEGVDLKSK